MIVIGFTAWNLFISALESHPEAYEIRRPTIIILIFYV